jgi:hypothetical protein
MRAGFFCIRPLEIVSAATILILRQNFAVDMVSRWLTVEASDE